MAAIAVASVDSLISSRSPNSACAAMTVLRFRAWPRRDSNHGARASNALVTAVRGAIDAGAAPMVSTMSASSAADPEKSTSRLSVK